jgi:WD40 repeat protein
MNVQTVIDFSSYIADRTKDFTGRDWVFKAIDKWLDAHEGRIFLLTGGPGSGKTAIASRLVQLCQEETQISNEYPNLLGGGLAFYHFCQAFNDPVLNPLRFVEALSKQLANSYQIFAESLLNVGSQQDITIKTETRVSKAAAGVEIKNVVIESLTIGNLSARKAFDVLVRGPLEKLCNKDFRENIVILVDSLDEALTYDPEEENILTLLQDATDHPADLPIQVRFILTSRPDPRVLRALGKRTLDLIDDAPADVDEVRDYAYRRLSALQNQNQRSDLARYIAEAAKGNFLYARYVLDDDLLLNVEKLKEKDFLDSLKLPKGLEGIYRLFLNRELGSNLEHWEESYRPLLGILAVSRGEGLTKKQLSRIAKLKESKIDSILRACSQYLMTSNSNDGPFRIYHQSFRDFLLTDTEYQVYPAEANESIANFFITNYKGKWFECRDNYALQYAPAHLYEADKMEELHDILLDFRWIAAKLNATDVNSLINDYDYLSEEEEKQRIDNKSLRLIQSALRLSAHILSHDKGQLHSQLYGRLLGLKRKGDLTGYKEVKHFLESIEEDWKGASNGKARLRLLTPTLTTPGGSMIQTLEGHIDGVSTVAITPDGKKIVSGSADNTIRVWDLDSGKEIKKLEGYADWVTLLAITPDGKKIVSGSADNTIRVWDLDSGKEIKKLEGSSSVYSLAITPDNKIVSTGDWNDKTIRIWDLENDGREIKKLEGHTSDIDSLAITPDGKKIVSGSADKRIRVWDVETGKEIKTLEGHMDGVSTVAITPDGKKIVSARDDIIRVWDLESGNEITEVQVPTPIYDNLPAFIDPPPASAVVAITPDGKKIVSGSADKRIRVWDVETGKEIKTLEGHMDGVSTVAITPDGKKIVSGSWDFTIRVWDLENDDGSNKVKTLEGHRGVIDSIAITPDGKKIVSGSQDNTIRVWDLESGSQIKKLGNPDWIYQRVVTPFDSIAITPDGKKIVSAGGGTQDNTIRVWDLESGSQIKKLEGHERIVDAIAITPDGKKIVSGARDRTIRVWDLENDDGSNKVKTLEGHMDGVSTVAITPDCKRAVSGSKDNTIRVWDLENDGNEIKKLEGHEGGITSIAITPDGKNIVSGSFDGTIKVWNLTGRTDIVSTFYADGEMWSCAANGKLIVAGDSLGMVHMLVLEE